MVNSKNKGNKFEREVAKWFTKWSGYKFERNRDSGAWHSNKDSVSDITCTDEKHAHKCKISIECKSYKEIKFEHVLLGNKGCDILKFWQQASKDAQRANRVPILCMRYNSMPKGEFFFVVNKILARRIFAFPELMKYPFMTLSTPNDGDLNIFMASAIKETVPYNDVHKQAKYYLKHEEKS